MIVASKNIRAGAPRPAGILSLTAGLLACGSSPYRRLPEIAFSGVVRG